MEIIFDEPTHTYRNVITGEYYTSVTTLIHKYCKPFDIDYHATRIAKREGVSKEDIIEEWRLGNIKSQEKGTKLHKIFEDYIEKGEYPPKAKKLIDEFDTKVKNIVGYYASVDSEKLLYSHKFKIAGKADLIYHTEDGFYILDFKTNKNFRFGSKYSEYLLNPLHHLTNCEFNIYALQLSMYAAMAEKIFDKKCKGLTVLYFEGLNIKPIHLNYMRYEVLELALHNINNCDEQETQLH